MLAFFRNLIITCNIIFKNVWIKLSDLIKYLIEFILYCIICFIFYFILFLVWLNYLRYLNTSSLDENDDDDFYPDDNDDDDDDDDYFKKKYTDDELQLMYMKILYQRLGYMYKTDKAKLSFFFFENPNFLNFLLSINYNVYYGLWIEIRSAFKRDTLKNAKRLEMEIKYIIINYMIKWPKKRFFDLFFNNEIHNYNSSYNKINYIIDSFYHMLNKTERSELKKYLSFNEHVSDLLVGIDYEKYPVLFAKISLELRFYNVDNFYERLLLLIYTYLLDNKIQDVFLSSYKGFKYLNISKKTIVYQQKYDSHYRYVLLEFRQEEAKNYLNDIVDEVLEMWGPFDECRIVMEEVLQEEGENFFINSSDSGDVEFIAYPVRIQEEINHYDILQKYDIINDLAKEKEAKEKDIIYNILEKNKGIEKILNKKDINNILKDEKSFYLLYKWLMKKVTIKEITDDFDL